MVEFFENSPLLVAVLREFPTAKRFIDGTKLLHNSHGTCYTSPIVNEGRVLREFPTVGRSSTRIPNIPGWVAVLREFPFTEDWLVVHAFSAAVERQAQLSNEYLVEFFENSHCWSQFFENSQQQLSWLG